MKSIATVILLLFGAMLVSAAQAEVYSWTDEKGVRHYSHTPPPERSISVESAPEIQPDPTAAQRQEKINEANVEEILKSLEQENAASPRKAAATKKPPTRQQRIAAEVKKLQEKIAWLEQLPPQAYTNTRSKQAIIGRYQYRLTRLQSDPDAYFKKYGN